MIARLVSIERATPACLEQVLEILTQAELPHEGVKEHLRGFLVARNSNGIILGCVGLERHAELGLLRSAAVLPAYRGQGVGNKLIRELISQAASDGLIEIALLTTTARDYFEKYFGFKEAKRSRYELRLQNSPEWNLPRCSSAAFMTLQLHLKAAVPTPASLPIPTSKTCVLILCTGNSARSQMAEGILRCDGGASFEVHSAGMKPSSVRPEAIQVMLEIGIDISGHRSKSVDEFAGQYFDYVITVCDNAKEACPVFPGQAKRVHQSFEDPPPLGVGSEKYRLAIFRRVRNEIQDWMKAFISDQVLVR